MKLASLWRICVSLLLTLVGLLLVFGLSRVETQAADDPPPYVQAPHFAHITTITTLTLPTRFTLLSPAFELIAADFPFTLTIDVHDFSETAQLAYRPNATAPWQRIKTIDTQNALWLVPNAPRGTYAVVSVTAATKLPAGALVIDDLSANFQRYGEDTNWHAVTGNQYYLEHAYWTYNTHNAVENYGIWTPTASLSGAYAVQVFVPSNYADTERAVYQIYHNNQTAVYTLSQNSYWAEWVNLGVYTFTPATASYVKLTDVTYEDIYTNWVAFDAVAFVPQVNQIYLPLVMKNYTAPPTQWQRTGIHMGNHMNNPDLTGDDWTNDMLSPFSPEQGIWPKMVVVQSDQVFSYTRTMTGNCRIEGVHVRNENIYNYLSRAASEGNTWVIFRINPSKGNFEESILASDLSSIPTRTLHSEVGYRPGNWDLCNNFWRFRPVDDIGDEILAIQRFTLWYAPIVGKPSWSAYGFEPANEPNIEWYHLGNNSTIPALDEPASWEAMDDYFSGVYDYVHANIGALPAVNVLTPPMAQHAYAEERNLGDVSNNCPDFAFSGYFTMDKVFNSSLPKNDGYSWHNYWPAGGERWEWGDCPTGHHLSMYFPSLMQENIDNSLRLGIITEADLSSPQMGYSSTISTKEMYTQTAESLRNFIQYEQRAQVIAVWLLHDNVEANTEHHWHQAYTTTIGFRDWFTSWWFAAEP